MVTIDNTISYLETIKSLNFDIMTGISELFNASYDIRHPDNMLEGYTIEDIPKIAHNLSENSFELHKNIKKLIELIEEEHTQE